MENGHEIEVVSPLESDKLIELSQNAEKRIEAVKKIKTQALRVTNEHDWTDQGGKPYLQVSGSEKIARLFGISWRFNGDIIRHDEENGHFSFEVSMEFIMSGATIEFKGSRSSKDPFFSKKYGKEISPSEIDKADVQKAAITNTIGNGITRLLGIRNLSWDDLKTAGLNAEKIGKVDYKKGGDGKTNEGKDESQNKPQMRNPDAPASDKQKAAIGAILSKLGIKDPDAKHKKVSEVVFGDPEVLHSLDELTMKDAGTVIDTLGKEAPK